MSRSNEGYLWTSKYVTEGLPTAAVQESSPTIKDHYDIIVIGAGFAGLVAARDLSQKHNFNVLLVEARDRIGGRTWTANVLGEQIEMGGTWVHWAQPHLYTELHRYALHRNLKTSAGTIAPEKITFTTSSGVIEEVSLAVAGAALDRVAQRCFNIDGLDSRTLMPFPHDSLREPALWKKYDYLSVGDRLNQLHDIPQWEKDLFESNISTFGSAPGKDIGFVEALRWFALGGHTIAGVFEMAGIYKIGKGGMTSLAIAILGEYTGDRLFNTAIAKIQHNAKGVELFTTSGRTLQAKAVISTIPLNCLGDIKFNPPLSPIRQEAIIQGHINQGAKIHYKLRENLPGWFWTGDSKGDANFVFAFSDHNGTQPSGPSGTWCIGFGYNGKLTDKRDSKYIIQKFKKDINPDVNVEAYATHDWMNDPYSKGTWACWGPNSTSKYLAELQRPHGRVIFANADWADGWMGFVDGAIERGQASIQYAVSLLKMHHASMAKL